MYSYHNSENKDKVQTWNNIETQTDKAKCLYELKVRNNGESVQFRPASKLGACIYAADWGHSWGDNAKMWNFMDS